MHTYDAGSGLDQNLRKTGGHTQSEYHDVWAMGREVVALTSQAHLAPETGRSTSELLIPQRLEILGKRNELIGDKARVAVFCCASNEDCRFAWEHYDTLFLGFSE